MRRLLLLSVALLASCTSAPAEMAPSPERSSLPNGYKNSNSNEYEKNDTTPADTPGVHTIRERPDQQPKVADEAAHGRPPESKEQGAPSEPERAVTLPDALEVSPAPSFPDRPRVAVAFVRGGKLVRRADALRKLEHDLEPHARIEALERFAEDAPSQLGLEKLCERAEKQGALLLVIDVRSTDEDSERTTYVLSAKAPWKALAVTRPRTTEPAGGELVARLVRTSRSAP